MCLPSSLHGKLEQKVEEGKETFPLFCLNLLDLKPLNETFPFQEIGILQLRTCFARKLPTKSPYNTTFFSRLLKLKILPYFVLSDELRLSSLLIYDWLKKF